MADEIEPFEGDDEAPLSDDDIEALEQDLVDVEMLKELLGPRGIKGVVFFCPDCNEDHYLTWDLLSGNLQELLDQGESPVHEPAFDPNPDDYVSWDYATGYLDGHESDREEGLSLVTGVVIEELMRRDVDPREIQQILQRAGLTKVPKGE